MKVLLSAYACAPDEGSEPEVGFQALLAAARRHQVWVFTQPHMAERLHRFLDGHPAAAQIQVEGIDPPDPVQRDGLWQLAQTQWRYDQWQRRVAARALELDRRIGFDVVHHITLAAYWMRTGVAAVSKPLVWGPVSGGSSGHSCRRRSPGARPWSSCRTRPQHAGCHDASMPSS